MHNLTSRMARYIMTLQGYNFVVKYRPGKQISNVDRLLRAPIFDRFQKGKYKRQ
ncbi:hypothetical protein C2G38_2056965 [Gigaspora rosea]|uniref:Reverse transcriptase RNase H-like domain-containing protein n=1 Tax=Gigaspora rosea TaxID=44941 RepID=A0A397W524_9GLOM|nr:hypothetical protein C2G38_2056965 [Gigaspora rosea]